MPAPTRRRLVLSAVAAALTGACAGALGAAPTRYRLDTSASRVGFRFVLNGAEQAGTMPVRQAEIVVDPDNLAASRVDVSVDVRGAQTPFGFATRALLAPEVLDADTFPTIRFVSRSVRLGPDGRLSGGAEISGQLTVRGVTRPVTLRADLYRARGSAPDDLSELQIHLGGEISRTAFGATGYPALVQDTVGLDIVAVIRRF